LPGREVDPAAECERQCERELVWLVLDELRSHVSECSYWVLYLRWIQGRSVPETAACLGLTRQQVWFRQHRVQQLFRRLFNRFSNGGGRSDR
jgi:hypothetical protein